MGGHGVTTEMAERVMVIAAHPDDAEFTVAGTVAKWAQQGKAVVYVILSLIHI